MLLATAITAWFTVGCASGGCPLDHSELASMEPVVDCLDVKGNKSGGGQCVTASLLIKNGCTESLQFASGWTKNGGQLTFAPGESGHYDALEAMETSSNHWETTAALGSEAIKFTITTYRR